MRWGILGLLVCVIVIVLVASAQGGASSRPCELGNPKTETLARTHVARIYAYRRDTKGRAVVGCLFRGDRRVHLDRPNEFDPESAPPYRLAGHFAGYAGRFCGDGFEGCTYDVLVRNLANRRFHSITQNGRRHAECRLDGDCGYSDVVALLLKPNGSVAWIGCDVFEATRRNPCGELDPEVPGDTIELLRHDRRGVKRVAIGQDIDPLSLRFANHRRAITWKQGGERRRATLR